MTVQGMQVCSGGKYTPTKWTWIKKTISEMCKSNGSDSISQHTPQLESKECKPIPSNFELWKIGYGSEDQAAQIWGTNHTELLNLQ